VGIRPPLKTLKNGLYAVAIFAQFSDYFCSKLKVGTINQYCHLGSPILAKFDQKTIYALIFSENLWKSAIRPLWSVDIGSASKDAELVLWAYS